MQHLYDSGQMRKVQRQRIRILIVYTCNIVAGVADIYIILQYTIVNCWRCCAEMSPHIYNDVAHTYIVSAVAAAAAAPNIKLSFVLCVHFGDGNGGGGVGTAAFRTDGRNDRDMRMLWCWCWCASAWACVYVDVIEIDGMLSKFNDTIINARYSLC